MINKMKFKRIIAIAFLLIGCAIQNPNLMHVEGNWESVGYFYQRIEINEHGKGYFAAGLMEDVEFCRIQNILFSEKNITINLFAI